MSYIDIKVFTGAYTTLPFTINDGNTLQFAPILWVENNFNFDIQPLNNFMLWINVL